MSSSSPFYHNSGHVELSDAEHADSHSFEGHEVLDEDEEVEVSDDDDLNVLPQQQHSDIEVEQKCAKWAIYLLGILAVCIGEFFILLPAYYLKLYLVGFIYGFVYIVCALFALFGGLCPGLKTPYSHLASGLFCAALAAFVGGMVGASFYQQAWYFDKANAYDNVYVKLDPSTLDNAAFVEFLQETYVKSEIGLGWKNGNTVYCAAPILSLEKQPADYVNYWAIDINCCSPIQTKNGIKDNTCQYWANSHTMYAPALSGEIYPDRNEPNFRKAISDAEFQFGYRSSNTSVLVTVLVDPDHTDRQRARRNKAYLSIFLTPPLWPIILLIWVGIYKGVEKIRKPKSHM